jgi:V8-like Glu-specific endopeptidase
MCGTSPEHCEVTLIPAQHSAEDPVADGAPPTAPLAGADHTAPRRRPTLAAVAWLVALALAGATGAASPSQDLGASKVAAPDRVSDRVGALFTGDAVDGNHYCTASVVDSPLGNMIVTAAHCLSGDDTDKVFAPGYRDGSAPHGVWHVTRTFQDPGWTANADEDADVAFALVAPLNGRSLQQVLGANRLAVDEGFDHLVTITGYPDVSERPITCSDLVDRFSATQMRIDCTGYSDGTSGSPWLIPGQGGPTHDEGTVIGVIGGFETGGYTDDISYSTYFGDRVGDLYREAVAADAKG